MGGRRHRANHFTGRLFALLAKDRLKIRAVGFTQIVTREISVDPEPVHFAASLDLLLADHRDVIFRLAGYDARIAADAGIQVDGHSPFVILFVLLFITLRSRFVERFRSLVMLVADRRIFFEFLDIPGPQQIAPSMVKWVWVEATIPCSPVAVISPVPQSIASERRTSKAL